jgi:hypothetical protein
MGFWCVHIYGYASGVVVPVSVGAGGVSGSDVSSPDGTSGGTGGSVEPPSGVCAGGVVSPGAATITVRVLVEKEP